ncbi:PH domain-containing protein [Paenibacillus pasadenensis]|uniref:PH domain-containing protein n=1 Tax=Paenibacillus pasadenensis TaxID=217090 RepID=UPI00203D1A0C|nr:PH domain-containing protein [Paenibacillus pasadenensis]MCM3749529.1 PH domain-containing protein [Paenibacillus pasadenensis]
MKFVPKRELLPALNTWLIVGFLLAGGITGLRNDEEDWIIRHIVSVLILLTAALIVWIWSGTSYTFGQEHLRIKIGPIVKRIPYRKLSRVRHTEPSPMSLFALRRIELSVGAYDCYQLAPKQEDRFLEELCERCPQLIVEQAAAGSER